MEESGNEIFAAYFDKYVGTLEQVRTGELRCYGEVYKVHPKFVSGVVDLYCYYKSKASALECDLEDLLKADRKYTVKGGDQGIVSWSVDTYKDPIFQAVFVARKFSLRVYHMLNLFTDAWNYGTLRDVSTVQGFGSGPGMELFLLEKFMAVVGKSVTVRHYDCVDWTAMGGASGKEVYKKSDLLITSFVDVYVPAEKLPDHFYHIALEKQAIEGYTVLNVGELQSHDKFCMMQNTPMTIHGTTKVRIVKYLRDEPFTHYKVANAVKDAEVRYALGYAKGIVLDVGAGSYDITPFTDLPVVRLDVKPRDNRTVTNCDKAGTSFFNMSFHHMGIKDIDHFLRITAHRVIIREIDIQRSRGYHDGVHLLHEKNPPLTKLAHPASIIVWMRERGWNIMKEKYTKKSSILIFDRAMYDFSEPQEFRDDYDRTYIYDPKTVRLLRERHKSMCSGPLRPFNDFSTFQSSVELCTQCNFRLGISSCY